MGNRVALKGTEPLNVKQHLKSASKACRAYGIRRPQLTVIRSGTHLVLHEVTSNLVVKAYRKETTLGKASQLMPIINSLAWDSKVPVLENLGVVTIEGAEYSFYNKGSNLPSQRIPDLAEALAKLHAASPHPEVPHIELTERFKRRHSIYSEALDPEIVSMLTRKTTEATEAFEELSKLSPMSLLHGDAQPANSVVVDKKVMLIDLDGLSVGPKFFDVLPMMLTPMRFGVSQNNWLRFAKAYSEQDLKWLERFAVIRETSSTTWLAVRAVSNNLALSELRERVRTWDEPAGEHKPWLVL